MGTVTAQPEFIDVGDPDKCAKCQRTIGRAGRDKDQLLKAMREGTFLTSFGSTDYDQGPPWPTTYYCGDCFPRTSHD